MSDSSEDEDLSRFKEAVDNSFTKLFNETKDQKVNGNVSKDVEKPKSERYLDTASHYNDVKVPEQMQKQIGAKISAIINKNVEFVDLEPNGKIKKRKTKGGVKLFKDSTEFLSCEEVQDTYTELHNSKSKKIKNKRTRMDKDEGLNENDKINAASISGDRILSKEETKCWKSRRKEKIFVYKSQGKGKMLTLVDSTC